MDKTTDITMKIAIKFNGKPIAAGEKVAVSEAVAQRWVDRGIAEIAGGDGLSSLSEKPASSQSKKQTDTSE